MVWAPINLRCQPRPLLHARQGGLRRLLPEWIRRDQRQKQRCRPVRLRIQQAVVTGCRMYRVRPRLCRGVAILFGMLGHTCFDVHVHTCRHARGVGFQAVHVGTSARNAALNLMHAVFAQCRALLSGSCRWNASVFAPHHTTPHRHTSRARTHTYILTRSLPVATVPHNATRMMVHGGACDPDMCSGTYPVTPKLGVSSTFGYLLLGWGPSCNSIL